MGNKGERRGSGSDDGYLDLMAGVVKQQIEDAYDCWVPLRKDKGESLSLGVYVPLSRPWREIQAFWT